MALTDTAIRKIKPTEKSFKITDSSGPYLLIKTRPCPLTEFVRLNRAGIGEITEQQQAALFNQIYPDYERRAETVYNTLTANIQNRTEWASLNPAIRDIVVDIIYNGFRGLSTMPAAAENNVDNFINYIQNNEELNRGGQRERSRRRVEYLNSNRNGR
ncbi:hypothetical protein C8D90_101143 [Enterobacillus tribolii]|uniref:Lysozyme n=1 Tax=Enterobacillus tribolii TaxID=1487935 RepID=A0A370R2N9_9GAMM|nr:hypothetical protein C8D90_101143 [Enterobacillus tribolii]